MIEVLMVFSPFMVVELRTSTEEDKRQMQKRESDKHDIVERSVPSNTNRHRRRARAGSDDFLCVVPVCFFEEKQSTKCRVSF